MHQKTNLIPPQLVERPCPICKKTNDLVFSESFLVEKKFNEFSYSSRKIPELMHFRFLLCVECGLVYSSPAPTQLWLERAYKEAAFNATEESVCASKTYIKYLKSILSTMSAEEPILDIGTGDGSFLKVLKDNGFKNLKGIEPSAAPFLAASKDIQPFIEQSNFNSKKYQSEAFNLVTSFMTLEHTDNPLDVCEGVYRILKNEGVFAVVVHNYKGWLNSFLKEKSPIYDIEHLQLYSLQSIRHLLQRAGFQDVKVKTIVNRYPLSYFIRLLPLLNARQKTRIILFLDKCKLSHIQFPMFAGNLIAVGYKRKRFNHD
jgi:SAM-dependent methyltransferase